MASQILPPNAIAYGIITDKINSNQPLMICRFGATEMSCIVTYMNTQLPFSRYWSYIKGDIGTAWWDKDRMKAMNFASGFFPATQSNLECFSKMMITDMKQIDILASWLEEEKRIDKFISHSSRINLIDLDPFFCTNPWTEALRGKKVLIIHPFKDTIEKQYKKRGVLFSDNRILPDFEIKIIKAVQGYTNEKTGFDSWFDALEYMKREITSVQFDIALIGCGAYGFPLAAHVKRIGKQAIHMGGSLQLLFGIKGKRWADLPNYSNLFNEHWVSPMAHETPVRHKEVESGPYW